MGRGPGVSHDQLENGRWRVRWREWEEKDGVRRRVQKSKTVEDQATAIDVAGKVLRALERGEVPDLDAVRVVTTVATVDAIFDGWLASREAKGVSEGSLEIYDAHIARALGALRKVGRVRTGQQIPGELLTRDGIIALTNQLRADEYAESTVGGVVRATVAAWGWASDDPETYPGITPAPRDPSDFLPRTVLYQAATAPTMD